MLHSSNLFAAIIIASTCYAIMDFREELQALTHHITRKYFDMFKCIAYVTDKRKELEPIRDAPVVLVKYSRSRSQGELLKKTYEEGCNGFIIWISRYNRSQVVQDLIQAYKTSLYARYNDKRYLFLPEDANDSDTAFLDTYDMYYMPNLVFIASSENTKGYHIYGHNFFHGHKYYVLNIKHEVLDTWYSGEGFERKQDLYPDKMRNLHGKLLRFSLLHYSPYGLVLNGSDGVPVYDGLETRVAAQFVEACNGTWTGLDNPIDLWGELFGNGSGTGVFGTVLENKADLGYSAIYQWYCDVLECSHPYIHSDVTCLAPKPEVISGSLTIILPFQLETWLSIVCFYLLSVLAAFIISFAWEKIAGTTYAKAHWQSFLGIFYTIFRLQLEQVPRTASERTPVADYYRILVFYTFLLAACWQGGISSFLTVPRYEKPINDARDLVERFPSVHWGANHIAWVESIKEEEDPVLKRLVQDFVVADGVTLMKRVPKKDFAYFMERLQNGHYALNSYINEEGMKYLRIMQKNIYGGYVVIILTRGSPYQQRLDEIILRMFDSGLIQKLELQVSLERINNKLQNLVRYSTETPRHELVTLGVTHIQGALFLYVLGVLLSVLAFLGEVQHFRFRWNRTNNQAMKLKSFL